MLSLTECILVELLLDSHQLYTITRRVHLRQTVARSTSAICYRSQSASRPNCCLIHISRIVSVTEYAQPNHYLIYVNHMLSLAECVSAKVLPDLHQPYSVLCRVFLVKPVPDLH